MKYKLINTKTKEETLCDLVTIDEFDYYVSDTKQPSIDGELYHCSNKGRGINVGNGIPKQVLTVNKYTKDRNLCKNCKLIIATNNPNINIPKVIDEDDDSYLLNKDNLRYIFNSGNAGSGGSMYNRVRKYSGFDNFLDTDNTIQEILVNNKVKETYHFTVQDMLDFGKYCINNQLCKEENRYYQYWEMLKLWKEQQTKIVYYE